MTQELINWILGGFGGVLGFLLKAIWSVVATIGAGFSTIVIYNMRGN